MHFIIVDESYCWPFQTFKGKTSSSFERNSYWTVLMRNDMTSSTGMRNFSKNLQIVLVTQDIKTNKSWKLRRMGFGKYQNCQEKKLKGNTRAVINVRTVAILMSE